MGIFVFLIKVSISFSKNLRCAASIECYKDADFLKGLFYFIFNCPKKNNLQSLAHRIIHSYYQIYESEDLLGFVYGALLLEPPGVPL